MLVLSLFGTCGGGFAVAGVFLVIGGSPWWRFPLFRYFVVCWAGGILVGLLIGGSPEWYFFRFGHFTVC